MISRLRVQNFRKHADATFDFTDGLTVITGSNGSGKTSLIEALYIALQGKSWRSNLSEILTTTPINSANWWRIDSEFTGGDTRTVKFIDGVKTFQVNETISTRLPGKHKKPVVLFEPNDLLLLYGSPARRRDFFDRFIAQLEPGYATTLRKFERVLSQRNNLLRRGTTRDELFVWDMQFVSLAETIAALRSVWVDRIDAALSRHYQQLAGTTDTVHIAYHAPHRTSQQLLDRLSHEFEQGLLYTKSGPQTHDITFLLNNRDAKQTASRGENRTILFAVLAAITEAINTFSGDKAYLIFDDVSSELDADRSDRLYRSQIFQENYVFTTTIMYNGQASNRIQLD